METFNLKIVLTCFITTHILCLKLFSSSAREKRDWMEGISQAVISASEQQTMMNPEKYKMVLPPPVNRMGE